MCTHSPFEMVPISNVFVVKIATFVEQSSKVLDVKIAMIGTGGLVGWLVGMVGTLKLLRTSFSCQSLFKLTN